MTEQKDRNHHAHAEELADLLRSSKHVVFFGGAGTSTESGIPDFRSDNGVFANDEAFRYPPEVMLSRSFYDRDPATFYRFYRAKMLHPAAKPNAAHQALARLEEDGIVSAVVTQNIDGLHQSAGSREVWELHGSVHRNSCTRCGAVHGLDAVLESEEVIPSCKQCGGTLKPDVVLYEESLDDEVISGAIGRIQEADLLIVGGTSLTVHPAASFVQLAKKAKLVLMNRTATSMDGRADAVYREPMGELFAAAYYKLTGKKV